MHYIDHICVHSHTHTHSHTCTDLTLTVDTVSSVLDGVQNMGDGLGIADWLQIPDFKRVELQHQYDRRQHPRAYSTYFLTEHPAPSWRIIALALWEWEELGALEVVQKLYLKGELCAHSCRSEGRIGSLVDIM